nr:hypothetical protein [Frateuria aurantia]
MHKYKFTESQIMAALKQLESGVPVNEEIKRWAAGRDSALVLEIILGKTTVAAASRQFDLTPAEIESWVEDGKRGMENALRAKP